MPVVRALARRSPRRNSATGSGPAAERTRVGPARDVVVGRGGAGDDDARGRKFAEHVGQAGQAGDREAQDARAGATEEELQRGEGERVGVELVARSRRRPGRGGRAGDGAMRRARTSQSVAQPAANAQGAAVVAVAIGDLVQRREAAPPRPRVRRSAVPVRPPSRRRRGPARTRCSAPTSIGVSAVRFSRARETAEEIDRPSFSASRSAAISPCVYRRCLPSVRCGVG